MIHCVPCPARVQSSKVQTRPRACDKKRARPFLLLNPPVIVHRTSRAIRPSHTASLALCSLSLLFINPMLLHRAEMSDLLLGPFLLARSRTQRCGIGSLRDGRCSLSGLLEKESANKIKLNASHNEGNYSHSSVLEAASTFSGPVHLTRGCTQAR
jgi:hypothetical protein